MMWIVTECQNLEPGKLFVFNINICLEIGQIVPYLLPNFQNWMNSLLFSASFIIIS